MGRLSRRLVPDECGTVQSMGLNDEPHQGGINTCGAERACLTTPQHEGPYTVELCYMSMQYVCIS